MLSYTACRTAFNVLGGLKKGKTVEEIADDLEENIEVVKQIYGNINAVGINKNLEVIIEQLTMK